MNLFAPQLESIAPEPPRDPRTLRGLSLQRTLNKTLLWIFLPFFIASLLAIPILYSLPIMQSTWRPQKGGLSRAQARVTSIKLVKVPNEQQSHATLDYIFNIASGETFYGTATFATDSQFTRLKTGAHLPVLYAPENPALNGVAGEWDKNVPSPFVLLLLPLIVMAYALLFCGPAIIFVIPRWRQTRLIFRSGTLTKGHIEYIKQQRTIAQYNSGFQVFFSFVDMKEQMIRSEISCDNSWLAYQFKPGDEITVVYLPSKPQQSIFLEALIE